eukprot:TRINITY_DN28117_c0_g1_i1.p1 TRINITY_DN28117_c0_g1~~TRINITY_DN28117_c0_g1_i1.p1  ORF type:complete len:268 (+),score=30.37 TRINITY_DN28117_c0_g1_i1:226-1029(+)
MGLFNRNHDSFSYTVVPDRSRAELTFDLSNLQATLPFELGQTRSDFTFPLGVGHCTIPIGNVLSLAQTPVPPVQQQEQQHTVPIDLMERRPLPVTDTLTVKQFESLARGLCINLPENPDARWRSVDTIDSIAGTPVVIEVRVAVKVQGVLGLNMPPGERPSDGNAFVVGRVMGNVELNVRARFEERGPLTSVPKKVAVVMLAGVVAVPLLMFLSSIISRRPAKLEHVSFPGHPAAKKPQEGPGRPAGQGRLLFRGPHRPDGANPFHS